MIGTGSRSRATSVRSRSSSRACTDVQPRGVLVQEHRARTAGRARLPLGGRERDGPKPALAL